MVFSIHFLAFRSLDIIYGSNNSDLDDDFDEFDNFDDFELFL